MQAPRQRTAEEERARAAAKQAERDLWERTRGAGSAVFKLAETGEIKRRKQSETSSSPTLLHNKRHQLLEGGQNGSSSKKSSPDHREVDKPNIEGLKTNAPSEGVAESTSPTKASDENLDDQDEYLSWSAQDVLPPLEAVEDKRYEPVEVPSADMLLSRGICEYTMLPKVLGRGKFSTVFTAVRDNERWAIKHTALFPHHQLIATRLLREPTLLAELSPHPNLVTVRETIRTPGHFYLVEEFLEGYVTLEALIPMYSDKHPPTLPYDVAHRIMAQLLSAVGAIHHPLQICHRDIKPENILVHPKTLHLKLLDFGLATHFSRSEAKLSTCCGSPAFHCPEIVKSLASPPGTVTYMGPDVDAWTCGVTMLRCLTGARFPLGTSHSSLRGMAIRAQRAVASIGDHVLRAKIGALLDMDANKRMQNLDALLVEQEKELESSSRDQKIFRSTTFIPTEPAYSIRLPIVEHGHKADDDGNVTSGFATPTTASMRTTPANSRPASPTRSPSISAALLHPVGPGDSFVALNPTLLPPERVISFVKYCLRCAGILYHTWPDLPSGAAANTNQASAANNSMPTPTRGVSAAFAEAAGLPLDTASMPWTPLFPPTITASEERADGLAHVQVFQCVMEFPEEDTDVDDDAQGQMTFMQSIMAAFGRKLAPALTPQTKDGEQQSSQSRSASPSGRAGMGKRSSSTPARTRPEKPARQTQTQSQDSNIRCLNFYLTVRFPKAPASNPQRQPFSRTSSFFGPGLFEGSPRGSRSRGSSLSAALSSAGDANTHLETNGAQSMDHSPVKQAPSKSEHSQQSSHRSRTHHGERESRLRTVRVLDDVSLTPIDTTRPEGEGVSSARTSPHPDRSPSTPRAQSRTRKRSHASNSRKAQVLFHVSDERAVKAVKDALSVGGSAEAKVHAHTSSNGHNRDRPLTPSMSRTASHTAAPANGKEHSVPSGLSVDLADRDSSPKEICLAIQERLEVIGNGDHGTMQTTNSDKSSPDNDGKLDTVPESEVVEIKANDSLSQAVEVSSLLHHLGMAMPRIKSQKPHRFIEPLVNLVPKAIGSAIAHDIALARRATLAFQKKDSSEGNFQEMPGTTRARKDTSPPPSQGLMATRAFDLAISLEALVRSVNKWSASIEGEANISHALLVKVVLASLIALIPQFPRPRPQQTLAEWYFRHLRPHYAFNRPGQELELQNLPNSRLAGHSDKAWERIRRIVSCLNLDLEKLAFEKPNTQELAAGSADSAVKSMGAFIMYSSLQVRERDTSAANVPAKQWWTKEEAHHRLLAALPLITATMGTDKPVATSDTGTTSSGGAALLPDAVLTWTMWCIEDLKDIKLTDEDGTILVHTLARHAALCPDPPSRHVALDMMRTTIACHVAPSCARQLLRDLIYESPSTPLRVATLGVARGLIVKDIDCDEKEDEESPNDSEKDFAVPEMIEMLHDAVFSIPASLPKPDAQDEIRIFLEEHGQWLSESLGFMYLIVSRDVKNVTGIRKEDLLNKADSNLVKPLKAWTSECLVYTDNSPRKGSPNEEGHADSGDIALSLSMLSVAINRAESILQDMTGVLDKEA